MRKVFISPLDVILEENVNRLQPDVVFIKLESVEVFVLRDNTYALFSSAEVKGTVASHIIEGFEIDINTIFP